MKKLTDLEKTLIKRILDVERDYRRKTNSIGDLLGFDTYASPILPDEALIKDLGLCVYGDFSIDVLYGYINNVFEIDEVYNAIEFALNDDDCAIDAWIDDNAI